MKYRTLIPVVSGHDVIEGGEVLEIECFHAHEDPNFSTIEVTTENKKRIHLEINYLLHFCERVFD